MCLALVVAGCGGTGQGPVASASSGPPATSTPIGAGSSVVAPSIAAPSLDLDSELAAAFGALAGGYRFESEVTVGDQVATRADGRRVAGNAEFVIESGGNKVTYRMVGADAWVRSADAAWVAVDASKANADPLAALGTPTHLEAGTAVQGATSLVATYPATALGLDGTAERSVAIVIRTDGTVEATYQLDTPAGPAISRTTFRPATDTTPIAPPP